MPGWRFDQASTATFSQPLKMSSYAASPIQGHLNEMAPLSLPVDWPEATYVDWRRLGKCVRWAFGIEASAALIIFGIWQLCRLWV